MLQSSQGRQSSSMFYSMRLHALPLSTAQYNCVQAWQAFRWSPVCVATCLINQSINPYFIDITLKNKLQSSTTLTKQSYLEIISFWDEGQKSSTCSQLHSNERLLIFKHHWRWYSTYLQTKRLLAKTKFWFNNLKRASQNVPLLHTFKVWTSRDLLT